MSKDVASGWIKVNNIDEIPVGDYLVLMKEPNSIKPILIGNNTVFVQRKNNSEIVKGYMKVRNGSNCKIRIINDRFAFDYNEQVFAYMSFPEYNEVM